jgi:hypothetical protein
MSRRKQSPTDRLHRLHQGRCPVHGISMPQVDSWYYPEAGRAYTVVGCPREDCSIRAKAYSIDGPWELVNFNI